MASLKVICPKCLKGQQIVVDIPPGGLEHVCLLCKTSFRVRPPARSSSDDLPAPREAVPRAPALPRDLPAAREAVPRPTDLPASREAVPRPIDLPVDRDAVPRPGDLPVDRNAVPRPSDLPIDRNAVPRPGDLPIDRNAVPRPGDLPIDRNAVPRPGDLPIDRDAAPRPGDLPTDRDAAPRTFLPSFGPPPLTPPSASAHPSPPPPTLPMMSPTGAVRAPTAPASALRPGTPVLRGQPSSPPPTKPAERPPTKTPPLGLSLDLALPNIPEPPLAGGSLPLGDPFGEPDAGSLDLGDGAPPPRHQPATPPATPRPPVPKPPRLDRKPLGVGTPTVSGSAAAPGTEATLQSLRSAPPAAGPTEPKSGLHPKPILAPLVPEPTEPPPASPVPTSSVVKPSRNAGAAAPSAPSAENADLGFSLEFESSPRTSSGKPPVAIPFPAARVASEGMAEAAAEKVDVPQLAPPSARSAQGGRGNRPRARKTRVPRWAYFAGGAVVLAAAGVGISLPLMHSAPEPDNVVRPFLPELAKDNLVAYQQAATALNAIAAKYKEGGVKLRLKAAELLLVASAAHGGGPNDGATGEQALAGTADQPKLVASVKRIRALVALTNGKPAEVDKLLADRASPDGQLALGLARLAEDNLPAAATHLRALVAARPNELLGHYLLGRASGTAADARKQYELVLAKNPAHAGAQVGLAQLEPTPEKRLAAAQSLAEKRPAGAGPRELAWLQLVIGQASHALGKSAEAVNAYQRAITHDKRFTAAYIALGEVLLYEGKYPAALERLKAAGAPLQASATGKFALGGATIATGDANKGLDLIAAAAKARPDDPRGPFWTAFAATTKQPPDFAAGEQGFRDALRKDPKFLPASLKLAAILQQQNRAQDSLAVLRTAEEAGAPPSVLQLAWGEALIVAGEPAKAQAVFEKALETDPKSVTALVGIAASLEAQGKLEEAKVSLERTLKAFPESLGLRERLAQVYLKLGQKAEALAHYQAEIQAGHPTVTIRLAVARLALDLDKIELAQSEAKRVLDQSPRSAEAAYYMARVYEARNSSGLALTEYRHATTWGNTPLYALHYGRLLDKLGKQQEALASFANAVALPEGLVARGKIHFRNGDIAKALADFEAAIKMNPKHSEPIILQALCYEKLGQAAKADESWRMALKVDPQSPEPHYRLGRTEMDRAKPAAAIDHFQKAMAKAPEDAPYLPDLCFQLAQAHLLNGAKTAALATFKKYLDIAPPNAPARPEASRQITLLGGSGGAGQPNELLDNQRLRKKQ